MVEKGFGREGLRVHIVLFLVVYIAPKPETNLSAQSDTLKYFSFWNLIFKAQLLYNKEKKLICQFRRVLYNIDVNIKAWHVALITVAIKLRVTIGFVTTSTLLNGFCR